MHQRLDGSYTHARAGKLAPFLVVQVIVVSLGTAWAATRAYELKAAKALPVTLAAPLEVRPTYDYPVVVSDEQLDRVLVKLRPKKHGAKTMPTLVTPPRIQRTVVCPPAPIKIDFSKMKHKQILKK